MVLSLIERSNTPPAHGKDIRPEPHGDDYRYRLEFGGEVVEGGARVRVRLDSGECLSLPSDDPRIHKAGLPRRLGRLVRWFGPSRKRSAGRPRTSREPF